MTRRILALLPLSLYAQQKEKLSDRIKKLLPQAAEDDPDGPLSGTVFVLLSLLAAINQGRTGDLAAKLDPEWKLKLARMLESPDSKVNGK